MPSRSRAAANSRPDAGPWQALAAERPFLLRLARLQLGSQADAEDAVQETLVGAARGWQGFAGASSLRSWLTGILRHKIVDLLRSRRLQPCADVADVAGDHAEFDALFTPDGAWHPDTFVDTVCGATALAQRQLLDIVELCLRRLPDETARLFLMREYLGMELKEIEEHCMLSNANLRVVLYRARMRLRECAVRSWGEPE
ncbi:sigma-70 family RNA polymerase sigma factor [Telluria beijingensis]|uniref:sigma-70 family RNA polymerase sigma factor n=1 Tax=Telluria beijingensis TaxID=3068633 RepID=UPI0027957531|nr:sigma-70 family RNA polymerase sigma factor [Massilia sp. REN29]